MSTTRIVYADFLRILAIFAVIILHTSASKWYITPVASFEWQVFNIYDSLVRWCIPVFFMVSGMFFLDPEKEISKQDIYSKYIFRLVCALVFWGTIYGLGSLLAQRVISHEELSIYKFAKIPAKLIFGPPWYHLWFLYTIIGLYILTPLLRIFISACSKKDIEYFLVLFMLFGTMLPLLNTVIHQMKPSLSVNMSIVELSGFLGYFIAGYYFSKYDISPLIKNILYVAAIISLLLTIVVTSIFSIHNNKPNDLLYRALLPNTMFTSYAFFILIKTKLKDFEFKENTASIISYISSCTFGIYLVHDMFIQLFSFLKISTLSFNPIFSIPLLSSLNFILSFLVVIAIKKIPKLNKRII
jgi:surface polysaccharide O-acyltransferase-like enzyme